MNVLTTSSSVSKEDETSQSRRHRRQVLGTSHWMVLMAVCLVSTMNPEHQTDVKDTKASSWSRQKQEGRQREIQCDEMMTFMQSRATKLTSKMLKDSFLTECLDELESR